MMLSIPKPNKKISFPGQTSSLGNVVVVRRLVLRPDETTVQCINSLRGRAMSRTHKEDICQ